ncbi:MAG: methionine synthase [Prevotella sp.]|nr:methionine synthase [Prevotella sp.]
MTIKEYLREKRLIMDGAMGTLIQEYKLTEADFRGDLFRDWKVDLKGNNDLLTLTRPDIIEEIHRSYVAAGADIIITNTFSSQRISQQEYLLTDYVAQLNRQAVRIARKAQPRFVVGDVGPTSRMLSMSDNVADPAARSISFDELKTAYWEQIKVLVEEGVDGILIETAFDTLNVKAAIAAYEQATETIDRDRCPLLISMTVSDASGRILSGQTVEAFVTSVAHAHPLSIGMNCGLGVGDMVDYIRRMKKAVVDAGADTYISCHANAGLPNQFGQYDDTPEEMVQQMGPMLETGLVDIVGGCCGTTPRHIEAFAKYVHSFAVEREPVKKCGVNNQPQLRVAGLEAFAFDRKAFVIVGERCNVAGSKKFLRLINEKKYEEALEIARLQVEGGVMALDVNMDDGLLEGKDEMTTFLNLVASDPSVCRVPIMIDSSRFEVIEAGLKCCQGKSIVNSISLKQGEEEFMEHARIIRQYGAAVIVMLFDEVGQATDYDRRIEIAERAYRLLVDKVGFEPQDIIFDPNILTVATGMAEHRSYALDFIRATEWIVQHLPGVRISGGLSNLSFAFRGNNYLREAMHAVFLHHAIPAGMNMAIMNPAAAVQYDSIDPELKRVITAVILNEYEEAGEELSEMAQKLLEEQQARKAAEQGGASAVEVEEEKNPTTPEEILKDCLLKGVSAELDENLHILLNRGETPLSIISGPLMEGMNVVGKLFGEGKMFLPQVVKTARTMKKAVAILEPYMEAEKENAASDTAASRGKVLTATVKGDVHDIGKNIVGVVLACNGFEVVDLGVMVPTEKIVEEAIRHQVDIVGLSGLITPSLDEMCRVAEEMHKAGLRIPLFVGGATTSEIYTAVKIAPLYPGGVYHMKDAAQDPVVAMQLLSEEQREDTVLRNRARQQRMRMAQARKQERNTMERAMSEEQDEATPLQKRFTCDWQTYTPVQPPHQGEMVVRNIPLKDIIPLIDWTFFYWAWRVKPKTEEARMLKADAEEVLERLAADSKYDTRAVQVFYPATGTESEIAIGDEKIFTPRQNTMAKGGRKREQCLALCDYLSPLGNDYVGLFATTVSEAFVSELEEMKEKRNDDYAEIIMQTLGDRLAEATAEYLSKELEERHGWGGIRPAVGYPSLPDQSLIFQMARLIDFSSIGITLTDHGAMYPNAAVSGFYLSHPDATYFGVDK